MCKNMAFRGLLKKVKSVIEHVHKSPTMRTQFEDLQFERIGTRLKLIQYMPLFNTCLIGGLELFAFSPAF